MRYAFTDTNILVAIFCFPLRENNLSLAHEVAACVSSGEIELLITDAVAAELYEVVQNKPRFSAQLPQVITQLDVFGVIPTAEVDAETYRQIQAACTDARDVPITASAIALKQTHAFDYLLSNDIKNFHTDAMKAYLGQHGITPVTLFGMLERLGRR